MADRIVVLRAGLIEQVGSPLELYQDPVNQFVASFLGAPRMNFVRGTVTATSGQGARVQLGTLGEVSFDRLVDLPAAGDAVMVGLRPEHLRLNHAANATSGRLRLTEELGRETVLYVDCDALRAVDSDTGTENLTLLSGPDGLTPRAGESVSFGFDTSDAYLFAPDGRTLTAPRHAATTPDHVPA